VSIDAPVFIGGAGRSGTTLLVDMLGLHSRLSPIYETDYVIGLGQLLFASPGLSRSEVESRCRSLMADWAKDLPHRPDNKAPHERFHHGPHHVLFNREQAMEAVEQLLVDVRSTNPHQAFRACLDKLFGIHTRLDSKPRWINKTPSYVLSTGFLANVYPEMVFINCVRDGRDVACSMGARVGSRNFDYFARWWKGRVQAADAFQRAYPNKIKTVIYEELLTHPEQVLGEVLEFVGESNQEVESMLRRYTQNGVVLDPSRTGRWRERFTEDDADRFWEIAGVELERFGYVAKHPGVSVFKTQSEISTARTGEASAPSRASGSATSV